MPIGGCLTATYVVCQGILIFMLPASQFTNNICETINNYGKGKLCTEKKIHIHNMKYEFDPVRRPMLTASKIWILGSFPITEKVLKETESPINFPP